MAFKEDSFVEDSFVEDSFAPDESPIPLAPSHKVGEYNMPQQGSGWKETVSNVVRPVLQAGGMLGGGLLGSGAAPVAGTIAGAGLGYAAGEQIANKLDESLGLRQQQSLPQELLQAGKDVGTGAAYEVGGQVIGKAVPEVLKFAGKGVKQFLGATTGTGSGTIEGALKGGKSFTDAMRGKTSGDEIVDNVRGALESIKSQRASAYQQKLAQVTQNQQPIPLNDIQRSAVNLMRKYGVKINANGDIDLSRVAMGKSGRNDIGDIIETIKSWGTKQGDDTVVGLDVLKRQLDDFYSESSQARQFVTELRNTVKNTITKHVPEYGEMTKGYADATNLIKDMETGLMLRKQGMTGRVTGDMTLRRLMSAMRSNNELRLDLLKELGIKGGDDLTGQVAGYMASDIVPRGLVGKLAGTQAVYLTYLNPKFWPLLAGSSPRVVGEFLNVYGKALKATKIKPDTLAGMAKVGLIAGTQDSKPKTAEDYLRSIGQ